MKTIQLLFYLVISFQITLQQTQSLLHHQPINQIQQLALNNIHQQAEQLIPQEIATEDNVTNLNKTEQYLNQKISEDGLSDNSNSNNNNNQKSSIEMKIEQYILFFCGLCCAILGICLEWHNEKFFIRFLRQLDLIRSKCKMSDFSEGDLIFVSGKVNYNYNLADPLFNLNIERALKIFRQIEMVQYEEKQPTDEKQDEKERQEEKQSHVNKYSHNEDDIVERNSKFEAIKADFKFTNKRTDYIKKWISYRVPILNFKNQDKIKKSQKYCKFIAETDTFQMNKISLSLPFQSQNQLVSPVSSSININNNNNNNSNIQNFSSLIANQSPNKQLSRHRSLKGLGGNIGGTLGSGSMTTPNLHQSGMNHSSQLISSHGGVGGGKIFIDDFTCFADFPKQKFNYNVLSSNEKESIINKVEDLRRLQVTFQDWQYDTHVIFNDNEVIISRKQDFKMHLGDNKMQHYFICADHVSVLAKLGQSATLVPFNTAEIQDKDNELIELDNLDEENTTSLFKKRGKELPLLKIKSTYSTDVNYSHTDAEYSHKDINYNHKDVSYNHKVVNYSNIHGNYNNIHANYNNIESQSKNIKNESKIRSRIKKMMVYIPQQMKRIFVLDENVYWGKDEVVSFDQMIDIKKRKQMKLVNLCRGIAFALILFSTFFSLFPILHLCYLIDMHAFQANPLYIQFFIAILYSLIIISITVLQPYSAYKLSYSPLLILTIISLLYIIYYFQS